MIVYVDHYGNAMTGLRAAPRPLAPSSRSPAAHPPRPHVRRRPARQPIWYANANGLAEIGVNGANAAARLDLGPGSQVLVHASA